MTEIDIQISFLCPSSFLQDQELMILRVKGDCEIADVFLKGREGKILMDLLKIIKS